MAIRKLVKKTSSSVSRVKKRVKRRTTRNRRPIPSFIELRLGTLLKKMVAGAVPQYKVPRVKYPGRNYYLDFAIPSKMICLECDGKAYHSTVTQIKYDKRRQRELEDMGWKVIRFTGSQIVSDIASCEKVLIALLKGN